MNNSYFWRMSPLRRLIWLKFGAGGGGGSILKTVTGTLLHITDALAKPAKKFVATLEPIQDLHGQDAPYPSGGGKNIFPNSLAETKTLNGITIVSDGMGKYTISGTATENGSIAFSLVDEIIFPKSIGSGGAGCLYLNNSFVAASDVFLPTFYYNDTAVDSWTLSTINKVSSTYYAINEQPCDKIVFKFFANAEVNGTVAFMESNDGRTDHTFSPYSNICPITGHTGANVYDDPKYDGLIKWNQLINTTIQSGTSVGITYSNNDGKITISGTATSNFIITLSSTYPQYVIGHKYLIRGCPSGGSNQTYSLRYNSNGFGENGSGVIVTCVASGAANEQINAGSNYPTINVANGVGFSTPVEYKPQVFDLTEMFGSGNEPSSVAEFEALFYKDYYPYNAGEETTVSEVNGDPYRHIEIEFPDAAGTVYGGTLDVTNGVLTVDRAALDMGATTFSDNGQTSYGGRQFFVSIPNKKNGVDNISCSCFAYIAASGAYGTMSGRANSEIVSFNYTDVTASAFKDAMVGQTLVYELATPITYTLTESQALTLLKGENVVWCDASDDLELQYYAKAESTP